MKKQRISVMASFVVFMASLLLIDALYTMLYPTKSYEQVYIVTDKLMQYANGTRGYNQVIPLRVLIENGEGIGTEKISYVNLETHANISVGSKLIADVVVKRDDLLKRLLIVLLTSILITLVASLPHYVKDEK